MQLIVTAAKEGTRTTYTGKLSYGQLGDNFTILPADVPIEIKQQRDLTPGRTNGVFSYLTENDDYIFTEVVGVVKEFEFTPFQGVDNAEIQPGVEVGILTIPDDSDRFLIDGQGRLSGITKALPERPELAEDFIDIKFVKDEGPETNQRMLVDFNKHAVKTSQALNIAFDTREAKSRFTKHVLSELPAIKARVDYQRTSAGGKSEYLWTINQFANFLLHFTGLTAKEMEEVVHNELGINTFTAYVKQYFDALMTNPQFKAAIDQSITAPELRAESVLPTAIMLETLGVVGRVTLDNFQVSGTEDWARLTNLKGVDFKKEAKHWQNRMVSPEGRIIKNSHARNQSALYIVSQLGLVPNADLVNALAAA